MQERLDTLEDEMETIKELLMSAASYAESASRGLDRVSTQQETNALAIGQLTERQSRTEAAIEALTGLVGHLVQNTNQTLQTIQEMQSEVRGLQTENRRILEILQRRDGAGE